MLIAPLYLTHKSVEAYLKSSIQKHENQHAKTQALRATPLVYIAVILLQSVTQGITPTGDLFDLNLMEVASLTLHRSAEIFFGDRFC